MSTEGSRRIIGQVVAANIASFSAGSELHQTPPLGSLVEVDGSLPIYAVVCDARTESIEGRRPLAHLPVEADLESFLSANPHLRHLLHSTFDAAVVGHGPDEVGGLRHYLPPAPAPIFASVRLCSHEEMARFTQSLDFLKLLLSSSTNSDEAAAACLRLVSVTHADRHAFLVRAGKELARLLASEPDRLAAILRRIRP